MNIFARAAVVAGTIFAATLPALAASAQSNAPMEINVGLSTADPVHLLQYIVEAKGFAKEENLKPTWILFQSGSAAAQAVTARGVDVMEGAIFEVIDAYIAGRDLKAFWNTSSLPSYTWYGPKKFKSVADLKGTGRVGVSSIASMTYTLSHWAVAKSGLDADKDVKYIVIGGPMERAAALRSGQVDLVPTTPPSSFLLAQEGYKPLIDLKNIMPQFEYETIYGRPAVIKDKIPEIRALLRATIHAKRWAVTHKDEAADILMKNLGAKAEDKAIYVKTVDVFLPYFPDDGEFAKDSINVFLQFKKDEGKIKEIPPISAFTDDQFIAYFKANPVKPR